MAQTIESRDLVQDKILKPLRDEMDLTIAKSKELSDGLVIVMKTQADVANSVKKSAKGYEQLAEAETKSSKALSEKEKLDKRILSLQEKSTKLTKIQREREAALSVELQRRNKIAKQEAQLTNQNLTAYERLQVRIKKLSDEYRSLIVQEGRGTKQSRAMREEILKLNRVRDKSNESLGMHQHKVGQYGNALQKLNGTLGRLGLAFGVFSLLRNTLGIISDFEGATASLSAITGATGKDLDSLKGSILDLATELKVSVIDTTKLFEIVGSQMPQLLKDTAGMQAVAKSAIILSKASGDTIESSTLAMASVMNQFSLGADQANRVMNVLAAGSLVGSAGISDVSEAMKNFGSVASGANIPVEKAVALIEVMGKFGVIGAESGTKLRGSVLKLQQANFGYASGLFDINDALEEAKLKMDSLGTSMEKDAFLQKAFGAENISTGRILLSNTALFEEYTKGVTNTNTATDQAAINSDTLKVVVEELKAAWTNLVVKWTEGTGVLGGLKVILRFVADNLEAIIGWVIRGVAAWASYKLALMLVNKEGTGFIQVMGKMITNMQYNIKGMRMMGVTASGLKGAMTGLGTAMKSIPFAGWVAILVTLIPMIWDFAKSIYEAFNQTTALERATEKYNEKIDEERAKMDKLFVQIKLTNTGSKERQVLIDEINATYGTTLENLANETDFMNQLAAAYKDVNAQMERRIMQQILEEELAEGLKTKRAIERTIKNEGGGGFGGLMQEALDKTITQIKEIEAELFKLNNMPTNLSLDSASGFGGLGKNGRANEQDPTASGGTSVRVGVKFVFPPAEELSKTDEWTTYKQEVEKLVGPMTIEVTEDDLGYLDGVEDIIEEKIVKINKTWKEMFAGIGEELRDEMKALNQFIQDAIESNIALLDRQIEKQQSIYDESKDRENELRDIARERGLDATESINAERDAQKKALSEISVLEQKKRNLELMIAAMNLLGQGKSLSEIKNELGQIKTFAEGSFFEGTPYTIADALGHTGTRDGHVVNIDDSESIFTGKQTRALGIGKGGNSTQDVVDIFTGVLPNSIRQNTARTSMLPTIHMPVDKKLHSKLDQLIQATESIPNSMPQVDSVFNSQVGFYDWQIKTKLRSEKTRFYPKK